MHNQKAFRLMQLGHPASKTILLSLLILLLSGYALWGSSTVPFHPDESTFLYMSSDYELLISQPGSLVYEAASSQDERQRYRLIDAPITRYYLGFVRSLLGKEAPTSDWDWTAGWKENLDKGAFPPVDLLQASRFAISLLFPLCLLLIFLIGQEMQGFATGILAVIFFGLNALVLLHNRRAMAEGWLTLGILLCVWGALQAQKRPWLAGLGAAIALNAKHSGVILLPVVLLAILWPAFRHKDRWKQAIKNLVIMSAVFLILTALLNPVFWKNPLQTGIAAWKARTDLVARQVADTKQESTRNPAQQVLMRLGTTLANLYLAPPAFYEVGNYASDTAASQQAYLEIPGHNLLRSPPGAGIFLFLTLFGLMASIRWFKEMPDSQRKAHSILWLSFLLILSGSIFLVPLPWQRYVIPLLPFICLWAAFGLSQSRQSKFQNIK